MTRNNYIDGGGSLTVITASVRSKVARVEHFWYTPDEMAELELEVANLGFAQACVENHAVPPTSTHFH